ncbi:hypothetical protein [Bradyrhizobium sp. 200]|uniref:hypothetical protein n=1 Tax=Bradyrhizobium sp. 200 TaxID=2782665 RepID=UPI001FFFC549|nr:hypothetical protein [Bradyrhizobium sp. 200]
MTEAVIEANRAHIPAIEFGTWQSYDGDSEHIMSDAWRVPRWARVVQGPLLFWARGRFGHQSSPSTFKRLARELAKMFPYPMHFLYPPPVRISTGAMLFVEQ